MADQQRSLEDLKTAFFKRLGEIEQSHRIQVTTLKSEFRKEFDRLQSSSSSSSSSGSSRRSQQRPKTSSSSSSSREVDEPRPEKPRVPRSQQKKDQGSEQNRDSSSRDNRRSQVASRPAPTKAPAPAKEAPKAAPAPAREPAPLTAKSVLSKILNSKGGVTEAQVAFLKDHLLQIGSNDQELTAFVDLFHSFASRTSQRRRKGAAFADLCETLHKEVAQNKIRFRAKLLQKCQSEFEAPIPSVPFNEETKEEDAKKLSKEKNRKLGNAGLIAYLVRNGLLKDTLIFNDCILPMLKAEDLDINRLACCCRVIRILGPNLDSTKGKDFLDPIFASLQSLSSSPSLSSSSSLPYLLALRAANWVVPPSEESSSSSSSAAAGGDGKEAAPKKIRERRPRAQVDDGDQSQVKNSKDDQKKEPSSSSSSDEKKGADAPSPSSEDKKRKRRPKKDKGVITISLPAEPSAPAAETPAASAPASAEEKKSEEKPAAE